MYNRTTAPLFLLFALLTVVSSCTVEKRLYNKGWHVSGRGNWKHQHSAAEKDALVEDAAIVEKTEVVLQQEHAAADTVAVGTDPAPSAEKVLIRSGRTIATTQAFSRDYNEVRQSTSAAETKTGIQAKKKTPPRDRWTQRQKTGRMIALLLVCLLCAALSITFFILAISGSVEFVVLAYVIGLVAIIAFVGLFIGLSIPAKKTTDDSDDFRGEQRDRDPDENGKPRVTSKASGIALAIFGAIVILVLVIAAAG